MMTVKHITLSGEEFVYPTTHVNFVPASALQGDVAAQRDTLWFYPPEQPATPLDRGMAFVMNEHGKTVANYRLTPVEEQALSSPRAA